MSHSSYVIILLCTCSVGLGACAETEAPQRRGSAAPDSAPTKPETIAKAAQILAPQAGAQAPAGPREPALRSGYVTYRDPVTGRLGLPVSSITIPSNPTNYSVAGLTPTQQSTGGAIVNLQGRFRSQMTAAIGSDGKLDIHCEGDRHEHAEGESDAR